MKNRSNGIPLNSKVNQRIISTDFPSSNPIFWGPNQNTVYPSTYNPPSGWRENDLLAIPQVVRFVVGGASVLALQRLIFLGTVSYGPGSYALTTVGVEISTVYSANKTTTQLLTDVHAFTPGPIGVSPQRLKYSLFNVIVGTVADQVNTVTIVDADTNILVGSIPVTGLILQP